MTLEEMIAFGEDLLERCDNFIEKIKESGGSATPFVKRSENIRQVVEWLQELKKYKEQGPCEDAISRKALLQKSVYAPIAPMIKGDKVHYEDVVFVRDIINADPVRPKIGHWKEYKSALGLSIFRCSICKEVDGYSKGNYCKWCGAKMEVPDDI